VVIRYDLTAASQGLRELKKARTRQLIADVAARLFAERGYERVLVSDVAREAEVSEQTVYNYFQTKEQLVIDRDQQVRDQLTDAISDTTPVIPEVARLQGIAIASVYQLIFSHAGQRSHAGRSQTEIASELRPIIEAVLDELDRWLSLSQHSS
jgi:AcrR family transcriptional regulator